MGRSLWTLLCCFSFANSWLQKVDAILGKYSCSQGNQSPGFWGEGYLLLKYHLTLTKIRTLGRQKALGTLWGEHSWKWARRLSKPRSPAPACALWPWAGNQASGTEVQKGALFRPHAGGLVAHMWPHAGTHWTELKGPQKLWKKNWNWNTAWRWCFGTYSVTMTRLITCLSKNLNLHKYKQKPRRSKNSFQRNRMWSTMT